MKLPEYILEIIQKINDIGYEAYVVGGCVRDYLLDRPIHDYDICTSAKPEVILNLFDRSIGTGLKHGTVTVLSNSPVEITTFRLESEYKDHRHPDSVKYVSTIEEDLSRRDFTVNAMAYHPSRGLIDPYKGQFDLKAKVIRCVGNPDRRFNEDALRMLRAYRFCAKLGFSMDETVKTSIDTNASLIQYVSIERIVHELKEIMDWSEKNVTSTIHICWGAQAGLYYRYGVQKYELDKKLSGIYMHHTFHRKTPLVRGFDDIFYVPHSRYTGVDKDEIVKNPHLEIVAESDEAGPYLIIGDEGKNIFVTGHPEYDILTLDKEYKRDLAKGLNPDIPVNYYPDNDPSKTPIKSWRCHANTLYANWLNYYVYQITPYLWTEKADKKKDETAE